MRQVEKTVLLQTLDNLWREHLVMLEHLRQVIGFRGYGQRDPLNEYKTEAFTLFESLLSRLREVVTSQLMYVELVREPVVDYPEQDFDQLEEHHLDPVSGIDELMESEPEIAARESANGGTAVLERPSRTRKPAAKIDPNDPATWGKVPRNAQCPCGSGKKYKHCHGKLG